MSRDAIVGLVELGNALGWWGALDNVEEQMNKMQDEVDRVAENIPAGETEEYKVLTKGDKFHSLCSSKTGCITEGGVNYHGSITIHGKKPH